MMHAKLQSCLVGWTRKRKGSILGDRSKNVSVKDQPNLGRTQIACWSPKGQKGKAITWTGTGIDDVEIGGSIQTKDSSEPGAISFQSVLSMKAKEILPKDMVIKRLMRTRKNLKKQQMTGLMINLMGIMKHLKVDPFKL